MFVSKQGMNIDGLGEKQIALFLELGWITDFASLFDIAKYRDNMLNLDWYKEKSVQNLLNAIESARHTTLDRVLTGLGIANVWKKTAKQIAQRVHALVHEKSISILSMVLELTEDDLLQIPDIGPETARAFVTYMQENTTWVERLFEKLIIEPVGQTPLSPDQSNQSATLSGKSFCVTGSFDQMSRDEIHARIEEHGGDMRTSVSAQLDYLIAWEKAGSKLQKAKELGVRVLDIQEFLEMIAL